MPAVRIYDDERLPDLCVRCGGVAAGHEPADFHWRGVPRSARPGTESDDWNKTVRLPVCGRHRHYFQRPEWLYWFNAGALVGIGVLMLVGIVLQLIPVPRPVALGWRLLLAGWIILGAIVNLFNSRWITPAEIDGDSVKLHFVSDAFIAALPDPNGIPTTEVDDAGDGSSELAAATRKRRRRD